MTMLASMRNRLVALEESMPGIGEWWYSPNVITYTGGSTVKPSLASISMTISVKPYTQCFMLKSVIHSVPARQTAFFNCKKLAERFPLAYGANFLRGATGGSFKHLMTLNELVAHSHPITNGNGVYTWDATSGAATVSVLIETTTNNTSL